MEYIIPKLGVCKRLGVNRRVYRVVYSRLLPIFGKNVWEITIKTKRGYKKLIFPDDAEYHAAPCHSLYR